LYTLSDWQTWLNDNADSFKFQYKPEKLKLDLKEKVTEMAAHCAKRGDGSCFPFTPMNEEARKGLRLPASLDATTFATYFDCADGAARAERLRLLFLEWKLRSFMVEATLTQNEELYKVCRSLAQNNDAFMAWGYHFADRLFASRTGESGTTLGDALTTLEESRVTIKNQKDVIHDLESTVLRLTVNNRGASALTATGYTKGGTRTKSSKLADVSVFYNDKDKDTMTFEAWYRSIENKLKGNQDHYPTEDIRIAYVESRLGGTASFNLQPYLRDTHPNQIKDATTLLKHL